MSTSATSSVDTEDERHAILRKRTDAGELIWHYGTWKSLEGIINREELWASDARYLNDSRELRESQRIIEPFLRGTRYERLIKAIETQTISLSARGYQEPISTHVVSFTKAFDSLSQWRGYTAPGPSFAIAFQRQRLAEVAAPGFILRDCAYTDQQRQEAVRESLSALDKITWGSGSSHAAYEATQVMHAQILAARVKHIAFAEEKEVRLIEEPHFAAGGLKPGKDDFFQRGSLVVPFVRVSIRSDEKDKPLPIDTILVGPTPHPELIMDLVEQFVEPLARGSDSKVGQVIEVHNTAIPYRNW
jgi:Protein of unknown function (DUF2971)